MRVHRPRHPGAVVGAAGDSQHLPPAGGDALRLGLRATTGKSTLAAPQASRNPERDLQLLMSRHQFDPQRPTWGNHGPPISGAQAPIDRSTLPRPRPSPMASSSRSVRPYPCSVTTGRLPGSWSKGTPDNSKWHWPTVTIVVDASRCFRHRRMPSTMWAFSNQGPAPICSWAAATTAKRGAFTPAWSSTKPAVIAWY